MIQGYIFIFKKQFLSHIYLHKKHFLGQFPSNQVLMRVNNKFTVN